MRIEFWGTRGSIPTFSPDTQKYGGNTPCVSISDEETILVMDAGSGIRNAGEAIKARSYDRINILLTHLHMDHIQGLGFFAPFYNPDSEIHIWGPMSIVATLRVRLDRYLSPPLFPVRIRDFPCQLSFHELSHQKIQIGSLTISTNYICHPGPTLGYRISNGKSIVTYIPDHEPFLGLNGKPMDKEWTSGYQLAENADLLIHDAQFTEEEYPMRRGWGHCTFQQAIAFAQLAQVRQIVLFHHDPSRTDTQLETIMARQPEVDGLKIRLGREGDKIQL